MAKRVRPKLRLLFDELLPWRAAEALNLLGFRTSYVGNNAHGQPKRGSSDTDVLAHAANSNQVVVTYNHDMIMLCAEQRQPVVWLDPRGRQFTSDEIAAAGFRGIAEWQRLLDAQVEAVCLRVLRTKIDVISLESARRLAERRMKAAKAKQATRRRTRPQVPGQLSNP
jgi:predicted nuclease of predicted toxin-antitoxin system